MLVKSVPILISLLLATVWCATLFQSTGKAAVDATRAPVVVELFTSEGCSSCPPVDAFLKALETQQPIPGVQVIALEEHVDYWNHQGWADPYSSSDWTARQEEYVSRFKDKTAYTPQMVVDGETQLVGNSETEVFQAIRSAAAQPAAKVTVVAGTPDKDEQPISVQIGALPSSEGHEAADVWLAVTESGLGNDVKAGENAGHNVQHSAVVRWFHKIGSVNPGASAAFTADPKVKLKSNWKRENLQIVVFVQERKSMRILGAGAARVAG